jgi:hypothetical protein
MMVAPGFRTKVSAASVWVLERSLASAPTKSGKPLEKIVDARAGPAMALTAATNISARTAFLNAQSIRTGTTISVRQFTAIWQMSVFRICLAGLRPFECCCRRERHCAAGVVSVDRPSSTHDVPS